ncbi:MAG: 30S ribosomal protein S17 [Cyanobacteria bacterium P01_H01_bin.74]
MPKKERFGTIVSKKMQKTVVVLVEDKNRHKKYKKTIKISNKFMVHAEIDCNLGDTVKIIECRPYSKHKKWLLTEVLIPNEDATA